METLIISDVPDTAATMVRALAVFGHKHPKKPLLATNGLKLPADLDSRTVLIIIVQDEYILEHLLWGKIRGRHENPVIVAGFKTKDVFGKKQPAFNGLKGEKAAYVSHGYMQIPVLLSDLHRLISRLEPVKDLVSVNNNYANEKAYLIHRIHFYPDTDLSRLEIVGRLGEVRGYFGQKGKIEQAEELNSGISSMPLRNWGDSAYHLRCWCETIFKEND